ncbi:unnamed protein product [Rotaria sordida]|uniref:Uncharacterized protein n=2 Tax=Rotaria sordida TaxID=392033 RepID=A0A819QN22_9BILA|nr:unnamed protein product [Rotaria sordida]
MFITHILGKTRKQSGLEWAYSSWTRWISVVLWWWVKPILSLGYRRTIVDKDLEDIPVNDKCSVLLDKVNCDSTKWPGTWNVIRQAFLKDYLLIVVFIVPYSAARIAQPLIIRETVLYIKGQTKLPTYAGYLLAIAISICSVLQVILMHQIFFHGRRIGMRVRNYLSSIIYKHLLTLNTASLHNTTAAQTINLIANDASKFEDLGMFFYYFWATPVEALVMFGLIWRIIDLPTLFGYAILILYVPMQLIFSKLFGQYRAATMKYTDNRIQTVHEIVNGCQIIKMYNWEKAMERRVREARHCEFSNIFKSSCLRALNIGLNFASLPLISLATFGSSWLMGLPFISEDIFTVMSFFALIRMPITAYFPYTIEKLSEARISAKRIDQFLQLETLVDKRDKEQKEKGDDAIIMENASFSWKDYSCLSDLNGTIQVGTLVGIKGATGAGKSSLLAAILGEMNLTNGKLRQYVNSISYAPQSAWIFADTIRANILLGKPMNEERYKNVIKASCLDIDLRNFGEAGDLMMVGDKGVNLSGGQKARISLARALYTDADLYLLDDPIAAVDPKVAKKIFDECIGPRSLLREKTRIFVTHQIHFLIEADQTIVLKNGRIDELHIKQSTLNERSNVTTEVDSTDKNQTDWTLNTAVTDINSIVQDEMSTDGAVNWHVWLELFTAPPLRWFGFILLIVLIFAAEALFDATNRWLAIWSEKVEKCERSSLDASIYLGLTLGTLFIALLRAFYMFYILLSGATYFHNRMLKGILYTSLRFFESNPGGRILNRASKDQQVLDESLPLTVIDTIQMTMTILGSIVIIGIINPWVLLILIPLIPAFWWIRRFFLRSSCQLKRLESVTRSPIYTLFSSSLDGLTSIRAFNVQADFMDMFMERIDTNSRAYFLLIAAGRWFGLRLDLMASLLTLITSILAVAVRGQIDHSALALSLTYCLTIVDLFQWAIRQSAEAETYMTSAERVHEYGQLVRETGKKEHESKGLIQPPNDWPSRGIIEFRNYTFRYRPELNSVLKNLNLRIESKEKIGVIGRTGMATCLL